jgi:hypothetical protein
MRRTGKPSHWAKRSTEGGAAEAPPALELSALLTRLWLQTLIPPEISQERRQARKMP